MSATETPTLPAVTDLPDRFRLFANGKSVVHRQRSDGIFLPIDFPERVWEEQNYGHRYHVYKTDNERVSVPAVSAIDAIVQSGVENPLKIVRGVAPEETAAVVIQAGRLVPAEEADTEPDQSGLEAPEDAASGDQEAAEGAVSTGEMEDAEADEAGADEAADSAVEPEPDVDTPQ